MGAQIDIEGYDYEELLDKWGLRKTYKKLYKNISTLNDIGAIDDDEMFRLHEEIGPKLISLYISVHTEDDGNGNLVIDDETLDDMLDLLAKLQLHAVCSPGDAAMYATIARFADNPTTMFEFYRWFIHCLPLMWN